jgi:hypothetical protein
MNRKTVTKLWPRGFSRAEKPAGSGLLFVSELAFEMIKINVFTFTLFFNPKTGLGFLMFRNKQKTLAMGWIKP